MHLLKQKLQNKEYLAGLICIAVSLFFFCLPFFINIKEENAFGLFTANFLLTLVYFFVLFFNRKSIQKEDKIHNTFLFMNLFFISAWSLNREMTVFEDSANWFAGLLVLICVNYISFAYKEVLPKWATHLMSFTAGVSFVTFLYLSLYLLPLYPVGLIGFFLIGVSLHVFVPLLFMVYTLVLMKKVSATDKKYWVSFSAGLVSVIAFVACYIGLWNSSKKQIDHAWLESNNKTGLPAWVNVTQKVAPGFFVNKMMKTELIFSVPEAATGDFLWRVPVKNFGEERKHDPLVMTAALLSGTPKVETDSRIKILESMQGLRHEGQERLWIGDHLYTEQVNTEVKLWPACNMAYTEKTITVTNGNEKTAWTRQEEAIYTFYLPEGGVVTSLSLWINGKEEKGIMTTKAKADSAYKRIVGVENRDPSVVQWQEGNTVSVRVFPVFAGESRMFKIGITAPLERIHGKLQYENVYFKGPSFENAHENILFDFEQPVSNYQLPASFVSMSGQSYKRKGKYEPIWSMQIKDPGLADCSFSFDNTTYSLAPYHKKLSPVQMDAVYLDINKSWTKDEFNKITDLTNGKNVFVFDSEIIKLQPGNKDELWGKLHVKQFSLFPLFEITDPVHSLLVTKSSAVSPNIDDLAETDFMKRTKAFLNKDQKVKLFDMGKELSPYLRSLKEFRVFQYDKGDVQSFTDMLVKGNFPDDLENNDQVIIHQSDMVIQRTGGAGNSSGPDHLMRLFTYNHIMQKLGSGLLIDRPLNDSLVEDARKAYVVSPVSSLVVLETQEDYERFNIKDADISLKNAALKSKGAVPEPHEWVLIIIALLVLAYVMNGKKIRFS
ncbi:MAG: XrtN system VIT domain-containing protein [Bacteroidota bacterium]